jgi:hypothetical protein
MKDVALPKPSISPSTTVITPQQAKKFVYFSAQTQGAFGRPVKIDPQLLPHFLCLVDPSSHQGQTVIRHIENLRAKAGTGDSFQNANRAFDFMDHIGNVRIHYKIMQADAGSPVGVYITDIRPGFRGDQKEAGLYSVQASGFRVNVTKSNDVAVSSSKACINGAANNVEDAAKQVLAAANASSTALFYNPSHAINDMGCWFNPSKQGQHAKVAAERLATVLQTTESRGSGTVHWHVHGEGAHLLAKALEKIPSQLKRHRFQFFNPIGNMTALLGNIKQKQGELAEAVVNYESSSNAIVSFLAQRSALTNTIRSLVSQGHPYAQPREKLVSKLLSETSKSAGIFQAAKTSTASNAATFLNLLKQVQGIYGAGKK